MKKTTISIENELETARVYLDGAIDEFFGQCINQVKDINKKIVVFNFQNLNFINSVGIRHWVDFLSNFQAGRDVIFEECSPIVVNQINMLPEFQGNAKIESIYGEFICEDCNETKVERYPISLGYSKLIDSMQAKPCPGCPRIGLPRTGGTTPCPRGT